MRDSEILLRCARPAGAAILLAKTMDTQPNKRLTDFAACAG